MINIIVYSIPSVFLIGFLFFFYSQNKDCTVEKNSIMLFLTAISFILCATNAKNDLNTINCIVSNESIHDLSVDNIFYYKTFAFSSITRILAFIGFISVAKYRNFNNSSLIRIMIPYMLLFLILIFKLNFIYIEIPIFCIYLGAYKSKYNIVNNIFYTMLLIFEETIFRNSYLYILIMFAVCFVNFKYKENRNIIVYTENEWQNRLAIIEDIISMKYLFVIFDEGLNSYENNEFLYFLNNISDKDTNNIIEVKSNIYAISFAKIDEDFGVSHVINEKKINSKISNIEALVKSRLFFPLIAEENKIINFNMYSSFNFNDYKKFEKESNEKNRTKDKSKIHLIK